MLPVAMYGLKSMAWLLNSLAATGPAATVFTKAAAYTMSQYDIHWDFTSNALGAGECSGISRQAMR